MSECEGCCHCRAVSHVNDCSAALAASQADFANACDVGRRLEASLAASQAEVSALKAETEALRNLLHRDRTGLAASLEACMNRARAGRWITEGRGSYEWNDDEYRKETGHLITQIIGIAQNGLNLSGKLADTAFHPDRNRAVLEASRSQIATAEAEVSRLTGELAEMTERERVAWAEIHVQAARNQRLTEDVVNGTSNINRQLVADRDRLEAELATAAASLERARLALGGNVSCPWNYKCRITEDRHVDECPAAIARAALAQPTPTATPGTEP